MKSYQARICQNYKKITNASKSIYLLFEIIKTYLVQGGKAKKTPPEKWLQFLKYCDFYFVSEAQKFNKTENTFSLKARDELKFAALN